MKRSLKARKSFTGLSPNILPVLLFVLGLFYTFYNVFLSHYNIGRVLKIQKASHELEKSLQEYREENEKLEQLLELVKKHPEYYRERFARSYMQVQKEDESIILLK
ncbi:MAG: hypothetical protein D6699_07320 [Aquificota bacterium]|nr:MAG: hypothetical protein D6699_07320 [Aquificota bacterium]